MRWWIQMAKLREITAEQYECLRELEVPVQWTRYGTEYLSSQAIVDMLSDGHGSRTPLAYITGLSNIHAHFYTLEDSDG